MPEDVTSGRLSAIGDIHGRRRVAPELANRPHLCLPGLLALSHLRASSMPRVSRMGNPRRSGRRRRRPCPGAGIRWPR